MAIGEQSRLRRCYAKRVEAGKATIQIEKLRIIAPQPARDILYLSGGHLKRKRFDLCFYVRGTRAQGHTARQVTD